MRALLPLLLLLAAIPVPAIARENPPMQPTTLTSAQINPNAPPELSRFAFLIGNFNCNADLQMPDGTRQTLHATWRGHYILDGYAIADEYRMNDPAGELMVFGLNFRSFDKAAGKYNIKWLDARTGAWSDLVTPTSGTVSIHGDAITYIFPEPTGAHPYTRATYTPLSTTRFTWTGEKSTNQKSWTQFLLVDCHRT
jgi:hypothetical protein